jgi:hypothetical protein
VVVGVCALGLGWSGSAILKLLFTPVDYTTTQYSKVLIYELVPTAMPIFLALVPMTFFALMEVFQFASWKRLLLIAVMIGTLLTIPGYVYNLKRWQPLVRIIQGLPLREVNYYRHTGTLGSPARMGIIFITPKESLTGVKQTIESRIGTSKAELLKYKLEGNNPLSVEYLTREKAESCLEFNLYTRPAFQGYDY